MFLLLWGPNSYLIHRQLAKLKERYRRKTGGDFDLTELDGGTLTFEQFAGQTQAVPLLATSRLILIKNIFKNKNREVLDRIKNLLGKIAPSSVVVFVEPGKPDKRLGLFRALSKSPNAKYFGPIEPGKLTSFVEKEVACRAGRINREAARLLADFIGEDLWRLASEIEKLIAYTAGGEIGEKAIQKLVAQSLESNVFSLLDKLALDDKGRAFDELEKVLRSGEPPLRVMGAINYHWRLIAQVKQAGRKSRNHFEIARLIGASPFQVKKAIGAANKFSWKELSDTYQKIFQIDVAVKTGKIDGDEGLKELVFSI